MTASNGAAEAETYEMRSERLSGISLEEVGGLLAMITFKYVDVRMRYSGPLSMFRRNMREDDIGILTDAVGDLLPLSINSEVQAQVLEAGPGTDSSDIAILRIGPLFFGIMAYMANFKNTGITVYSSQESYFG